ncbi:MAG: hypothetical protein KGH81_02585 [Thaumarchaeota archaeon]|nr:hypothetical protein [Nitrososphaerota archaeon]
MNSYLDTLYTIEKQIDTFTSKIASESKDDSRVRLLMTIPGIDTLLH